MQGHLSPSWLMHSSCRSWSCKTHLLIAPGCHPACKSCVAPSMCFTCVMCCNTGLERSAGIGHSFEKVRVLEPKRTVQQTEGGLQQGNRRVEPPLPPLFPKCPQSSAIGYDWHCMCTIRMGGDGMGGCGEVWTCTRASVSLHAPRVTSHARALLPPDPPLTSSPLELPAISSHWHCM